MAGAIEALGRVGASPGDPSGSALDSGERGGQPVVLLTLPHSLSPLWSRAGDSEAPFGSACARVGFLPAKKCSSLHPKTTQLFLAQGYFPSSQVKPPGAFRDLRTPLSSAQQCSWGASREPHK